MTSTTPAPSSAARWGALWGARPDDWAVLEAKQRPVYEEALRRIQLAAGHRLLDVGCGAGSFLRLAADRGAEVHGVDASEPLLAVARRRLPEADLRLGSMEALPHDDGRFDVVTGFNSFFFADDMVAALREARRVAKPGASVVIQVWGRPERCDLTALKEALAPFLPPPPPGASADPPLWQPGVLEDQATAAGLTPEDAFDRRCPLEFAGAGEVAREMLSPANVTIALQGNDEATVRDAVLRGLERFRTPHGGYRLENEWHYLLARA